MESTASYSERIDLLRNAINEADHIIIGAGSGLSTAAGLDYVGEDFRREFAADIEKYGHTDLYSAGFYRYSTAEEYWAHWAKHIWFCRYRTGAFTLNKQLQNLFPNAFVVTTCNYNIMFPSCIYLFYHFIFKFIYYMGRSYFIRLI